MNVKSDMPVFMILILLPWKSCSFSLDVSRSWTRYLVINKSKVELKTRMVNETYIIHLRYLREDASKQNQFQFTLPPFWCNRHVFHSSAGVIEVSWILEGQWSFYEIPTLCSGSLVVSSFFPQKLNQWVLSQQHRVGLKNTITVIPNVLMKVEIRCPRNWKNKVDLTQPTSPLPLL